MKPIDRRAFINTLAATLAAGYAGAVTESCTALRGGYKVGKTGSRDPAAALARLDRNCRALRRNQTLRKAESVYRKSGCNTDLLPDALETLLVVGMFGDLGEKERMDPRVRKRVQSAMPVMTDAFLGMATYMESLGPHERALVRQTLNEQPEIMSEFQVQFDAASREHDVPQERLEHFHSLFNQCAWRLKNQDPSSLIDECVALVDKEGERHGISPALRRSMVATGGFSKSTIFGADYAGADDDQRLAFAGALNDSTVASDADNPRVLLQSQQHEKGKRQLGTGAALMGLGAVALTAGIIIGGREYGNDAAFTPAVVFGCVGGAICLIVGLILIIIGAVNLHRSWANKNSISPRNKYRHGRPVN
jgi:hypothetical protein